MSGVGRSDIIESRSNLQATARGGEKVTRLTAVTADTRLEMERWMRYLGSDSRSRSVCHVVLRMSGYKIVL